MRTSPLPCLDAWIDALVSAAGWWTRGLWSEESALKWRTSFEVREVSKDVSEAGPTIDLSDLLEGCRNETSCSRGGTSKKKQLESCKSGHFQNFELVFVVKTARLLCVKPIIILYNLHTTSSYYNIIKVKKSVLPEPNVLFRAALISVDIAFKQGSQYHDLLQLRVSRPWPAGWFIWPRKYFRF